VNENDADLFRSANLIVTGAPQRIARLGIGGPPCDVTDIAEILIPARSNGVRAVLVRG
jgi:hypothetical protein